MGSKSAEVKEHPRNKPVDLFAFRGALARINSALLIAQADIAERPNAKSTRSISIRLDLAPSKKGDDQTVILTGKVSHNLAPQRIGASSAQIADGHLVLMGDSDNPDQLQMFDSPRLLDDEHVTLDESEESDGDGEEEEEQE